MPCSKLLVTNLINNYDFATYMYKAFYFIAVLPHITPFEFEGEANTDESVQLTCYVGKGDTPLTITWTLNGKKIVPHSGITTVPIGDRTSLLIINSVQAEHSGVFTCTASNRAGKSSHNATLFVNGTYFEAFVFLDHRHHRVVQNT